MADSESVQTPLASAYQALEDGQPGDAVQLLRGFADGLEPLAILDVLGRAASALHATDIAQAARHAVESPEDAKAFYDIGYMCVGQGLSYLAIPLLKRALELAPLNVEFFMELVIAFEDEARHADAVAIIEMHPDLLQNWVVRYFHTFNSIMAGDVLRARTSFQALGPSEEPDTSVMFERVVAMMDRLERASGNTSLDENDLRGWHYVINACVLGELSPYGFNEGMTGRYAYTQDSAAHLRYTLDRLGIALAAAERRPTSISLLPDRSSRIVGLAASRLLGLPASPWTIDRSNTLVVAYDLHEVEQQSLAEIRVRQTEQVLFEHATCWTSPGPVSADFSGFLHQVCKSPWSEDGRSEEEWANDIANTPLAIDKGDGSMPPDTAAAFATFVASVKDGWSLSTGVRDRVWSPGPVRSSRFL